MRGDKTIFTDPWLCGPAFLNGWWLEREPPESVYQELASCDAIYISHSHEDHLNWPTLSILAQINPRPKIFVADLDPPVFNQNMLRQSLLGTPQTQLMFESVTRLQLGEWHYLDNDTRMMILPDGTFSSIDTCALFEYKGHLILNTVDCRTPNGDHLPEDVDLLLTEFAGASFYL